MEIDALYDQLTVEIHRVGEKRFDNDTYAIALGSLAWCRSDSTETSKRVSTLVRLRNERTRALRLLDTFAT